MTRSIILLIHGAFWLGNLILLTMIMTILSQTQSIEPTEILYFSKIAIGFVLVPGLFAFYAYYFFLFPKYLQKRKLTQAIFYGSIIAVFAALAGVIALYFLVDFVYSCYQQSNFFAIPLMAIWGIVYGFIALVIKGFITWYEEIKIKEMLQEKNHSMELALVKSQLDPHFLFNTINNIDVLILKNANKASNFLNKLSDIMRFMLFETKTDEILLSKEIEYIEKYIGLQKIRTANTTYVNYTVIGKADQQTIAPMIFIPFIENAFKHTTNKKVDNAINIKIIIEKNRVKLECVNKFDPYRKSKPESHGLGNDLIQKRLNLIYPEAHQLTIRQVEDSYTVELIIDTKDNIRQQSNF